MGRPFAKAARALLLVGWACAGWTPGHGAPSESPSEVLDRFMEPNSLERACQPRAHVDWIELQLQQRPVRIAPVDCQVSQDNPPAFVWPTPTRGRPAARYEWALADATGRIVDRRHTQVPYLHLSESLPAGDYAWRVTATIDGVREEVSNWRHVTIAVDSRPVALAQAQSIVRAAMDKPRPRLLPVGDAWQAVQAAARSGGGAWQSMFESAQAAAQRESRRGGLLTEPAPRRGADDDHRIHQAAVAARRVLVSLAVCGHLAGRDDWLDRAAEMLVALGTWNPVGSTSEASQDQANREVLLALAIGYDLLHARLDDAQRQAIAHSAASRMRQQHRGAFAGLRDGYYPFDSHGINGATMAAAAAVLMADAGNPFESMAHDYLGWLVPNMLPWVDESGADGASHAYGWFNLLAALPPVVAVRLATGSNLSQRAALRHAPRWIEAFTPPVAPGRTTVMTFGDASDTRFGYMHHFRAAALSSLAALQEGRQEEAAAPVVGPASAFAPDDLPVDPLVLLLPRPPEFAGSRPTRRSAVFDAAGLVAVHSDDPPDLRSSLYFRASGLGTLNHAMGDNGSIVFVARGWPVLVNSSYYDSYGSPHHAFYARHTRAKNALTVDGGTGQAQEMGAGPSTVAHSRAAAGRFTAFADRGPLTYASADLEPAYRTFVAGRPTNSLLRSYQRSIVYHHARRTAYIVDEAESAVERTFELNFHTPHDPVLRGSAAATMPTPAGNVCLDVLDGEARGWRAHLDDRFATSQGIDVEPTTPHRRHRHLVLATSGPSRSLRSVTVLREDCAQELPRLNWGPSPSATLRVRYEDGSGFELTHGPAAISR